MRIAGRLGAGFGVLTLLLLVGSGAGATLASGLQSTSRAAQSYLVATRELKQFQLDGESVAVCENSVGFDYNSHSDPSDDLAHLQVAAGAFERDAAAVQSLPLTPTQRATLRHARDVFTVYIAQSRRANRDFARGTPASVDAGNDLINGLAYVGVTRGLDRLAVTFSEGIDERVHASVGAARRAQILVRALGASGVLGAVVLSVLITRSIVRPLRRTVDVLDAVAAGDLTKKLAVTSSDEIGRMARALNRTVDRLRDAMDDLTVRARTDPLTGLPNRAAFGLALGDALMGSAGGCCSVLFVDLDDFKRVNDSLGHRSGDAVLVALAARLCGATRPGDVCARLGGDEFAVLLPLTDATTAEDVARRIIDATSAPVVVDGQPASVGVSIGVASATTGTDAEQVIAGADLAMYAAKAAGKGTVRVHGPDLWVGRPLEAAGARG